MAENGVQRLAVACPTYKRFDLCVEMVLSSDAGTVQPEKYVILDNSAGGFIPYLQEHKPEFLERDDIVILEAAYNTGVARGWNILLDYVAQNLGNMFTVIVNDDIVFLPDTLEKLFEHRNKLVFDGIIVCGDGIGAPNAFSMFGTYPELLMRYVGRFDETIYPAYFDDNDMHYRMKLTGFDLYRVPDCGAYHNEGGSATIKAYTNEERALHDHQFRRNQEYFVRKWGGMPGEETYTIPFNGEDIMRHMLELYKTYGF